MEIASMSRITFSFYRYVILENPENMRDILFEAWSKFEALGRIYVAREGINAQMNVPEHMFVAFKEQLYNFPEFKDIPFKIAVEEKESFDKLKIKVRKKIVADGLQENEYDVTNVGTHLSPQEFQDHLKDPNTLVVDMRNHYESRIGKFEGALCPDADTFAQALPEAKKLLEGKEETKILLYCTGGIRCEKASAYLKHHGFKDVNQLYGGIIQYGHEIPNEESKFHGKNFVFDRRLSETITEEVITNCDQCNMLCDTYHNCQNVMCNLLFIQCEKCSTQYEGCCSEHCKAVIHLSEEEQRHLRKSQPEHTFQRYRKMIRPELNIQDSCSV